MTYGGGTVGDNDDNDGDDGDDDDNGQVVIASTWRFTKLFITHPIWWIGDPWRREREREC